MSQQIRVNLMFDANTQAAQTNIQQLAVLLQKIATPKNITVNSSAIQSAAQAAQSLQVHLQKALNVNTGKLDLARLNMSLKQSNQSLSELSSRLLLAGTQGQQAFVKLSTSIATAGKPAMQLSATISSFLRTMGSAMMWSAAYGALNKITEVIGDAITYTKDLNKALTDIAIVSDLSAKELDKFAEKAAKAAKNLNSTTTEYAKAALIFYQQGLGGQAVEERANVVTKLAQVTGESAQAVSDQMTAVWNNFDDGTKSLEYYADAITALGAATASSSKEITQGLEKFAAIADTVGLSYEYATAALATVVANTRQSADVVGTAFKTLFARIQDLELGETLDDGVTLGKYSQAIKAVGVDIMTQNGEMKKMDVILDELGAKWDNLSKAQQTSLAQTVAGMRQYTQFIAIMDNYDEFKGNVKIASDAEGTLTEQWETWADSYEGAAKRVEQRSNELYEALLDDDFVIDMTNAFASFIGTIGSAIDAIGGLGPVLLTIIALFSKQLMPFITQFGVHMASAWQLATGKAYENATAMRQATKEHIDLLIQSKALTENYKEQAAITSSMLGVRNSLEKASRFLNAAQKEELTTQMQLVETLGLQAQGYYEVADAARKAAQESRKNVSNQFGNEITRASRAFAGTAAGQGRTDLNTFGYDKTKTIFGQTQETYVGEASAYFGKGGTDDMARRVYNQMREKTLGLNNIGSPQTTANMDISIERIEQLTTSQIKYDQAVRQAESALETLNAELQNGGSSSETMEAQVQEQYSALKKLAAELGVTERQYKNLFNETDAADVKLKKIKDAFLALKSGASTSSNSLREVVNSMLANDNISDELRASLEALRNAMIREAEATQNAKTADQQYQAELERMNSLLLKNQAGLSFYVTGLARIAGQASMAISALQMLGNLDFENNSMQSWMTLLMSMSMLLPVILGLITGITTAKSVLGAISAINIGLKDKENKLDAKGIALQFLETKGIESDTAARWANVAAQMAQYWYIGLIIAIIAALIAILVILIKNQKSATEVAAESKAGMESLAAAYEEAKNAAAELQEQIKKFKDLDDSLDGLDQGTEEYNQKLKEVNEEATKLIKQFNLLRGTDWNWEGGRIVFEDGVLEDVQDRADAKAEALADSTIMAQRDYFNKQKRALANQYSNENPLDHHWDEISGSDDAMLNAANWYNAQEGPVSVEDFKQWMQTTGAGGAVTVTPGQNAYIGVDDTGPWATWETLFKELEAVTGEFAKLDASLAEANRALTEDLVEGIYGAEFRTAATNSEGVVDKALENQLTQAMTTLTDNSTTRAEMQAEIDAIEFTTNNNNAVKNLDSETARKLEYNEITNDKMLAKKYAEVMLGATEEELANFTYTAGSNQGKFKFGADGTEYEYSDDYMREQLYRYAKEQDIIAKYQGDLTEETEAQKNALLNIVRTANADVGGALLDAVTAGDISSLNLSSFMAELDESEVAKLKTMGADALLAHLGLSEEDLKDLGISKEELVKEIQNNLDDWDFEAFKANVDAKAESTATSLGLDVEAFKAYRDELYLTNEELAKSPKLLNDVAIANLRLSNGLKTASSKMDEWKTALSGGENSVEGITAIAEMRQSLGDILNIDTSKMDSSFIRSTAVMEQMEKAAEGDADAVERLRELTAQQVAREAGLDLSKPLEEGGQSLLEVINAINDEELEIGATIEDSAFMQTLHTMLEAQGATVADMQKIFNSLGWTPEIEYQKVKVKSINESEGTFVDENGKVHKIVTGTAVGSEVEVPFIKKDGDNMPSITYRGRANTATTKTKDKGGSSKDKKVLEDEVERYHEIDRTLDSLSKKYDRLSNARDRAFGAQHIAYLEAELDILEEQSEAIDQKIKEAEEYYEKDRAALEKYGASFDENGNITNYDELYAAQIAQYNKNPEAYEKSYGEFEEAISRYEETLDTMEDLTDEKIQNINDSFDKKLAIINYTVELKVRLADNWLELIEFQMDNLTDSVADAADKFALLGHQIAQTENKMNAAKDGIAGLLGASGISLDDILAAKSADEVKALIEDANLTEEQVSQLETYLGDLYSGAGEMREMLDQISDNLVAAFEDMNKEFDKSIEKMEHFTSMAEGYRNIIDLAGKQALGISSQLMKDLAYTTYSVAQNNIQTRKAQLEQNLAAQKDLQEKLAEANAANDTARAKEIEEALEEIDATVRDNQQSLLDATAEGLEAATQLFQTEMDNIFETFENSMAGLYGTFSALQESFDQQKELDDWYLDDYEKIYELSKLNRDIINSIDESDSIHAKERLRDLQEEINALQESNTEMTQYEVDSLRAKYELRLAEIALEEAQNAKSQVRMRRDSEGNWGYVYTADEAAIGAAEQNYEDKLYAYQNTLNEQIDELEARLVSLPQEYMEAVRAIYEDQTLTDEERRLRIQETQEHYQAMHQYVVTQLGYSLDNAKLLYEEDWSNYNILTGYKISKDEEWIDSFEETVYSQKTGLSDLSTAHEVFKTQISTTLSQLQTAYSTYRTNVNDTLDLALGDVEDFFGSKDTEGTLSYYLEQMRKQSQSAADAAEEIGEKNKQAFSDAVNAANEWLSKYGTAIQNWVTETDKIGTAVNNVITQYANLDKQIETTKGKYKELEQQAKDALKAMQEAANYTPPTGTNPEGTKGNTFSAYATAKKDAVDDNKYIGMGAYTQRTAKAGTIKKASSFDANIDAGGVAKITYEDANSGNIMTAYIDRATARALGIERDKKRVKDLSLWGYSTALFDKLSKASLEEQADILLNANIDEKKLLPVGTEINPEGSKTVNGKKWYRYKGFYYPSSGFTAEFDTGGYTGSWDSSGRLAMLHQKELVLNAKDTANFLSAVDILRDITSIIDLQALSQSNMLSALSSATAGVANQVIEQEVTIHAEFPNATNHSEIEEAFNSLLNRASQFANRKNK